MRIFDLFCFKYNRTDFHELNLDWIISDLRTLAETLENFISLNTIKYANPIQWNITTQYEANTVVIDANDGTAYLSVKPVPTGVALTNTDYWTPIFTLNLLSANQNITLRDDGSNVLATFASDTDDWLIWNSTLYKVSQPIAINEAYVAGYNLTRYSVELFLKDAVDAINLKIGELDDLDTTDKTNIVAAINEINGNVGNLNDLITTNKNSIVEAINEVKEDAASIKKVIFVADLDGIIFNDNSAATKASNATIIEDALIANGQGTLLYFNNGDDICYFDTVNISFGMDNITVSGGIIAGTFKVLGNGQSRSQVVFYPNFINCTFIFDSTDTTSDAIQAQFTYMMNVKNCNFRYGNAAIHILDSNDTGGSPRCQFSGNTFEYMNYAILGEETYVQGAYNKSMSDPEIKDNIFVECKTGGIRIESTDGCTLEGNTFYDCQRALYLSECPYSKIIGNTFFEPDYYNIYLYHCATGIIANNQIQGSGSSDASNNYASIIIENYAQFANGQTGIKINGNLISHNRNDAIKLTGCTYVTVENNLYFPEGNYAQAFLHLNGVSRYACRNNDVYMGTDDWTTHKFIVAENGAYLWNYNAGTPGRQIYNGTITGDGTTGWHTATITFAKGFATNPIIKVSNTTNQDSKALAVFSVSTTQCIVGFYGTLSSGYTLSFNVEAIGVD